METRETRPPAVLSEEQRESYLRDGYLLVESLVPADLLERVRAVVAEFVERSRSVEAPNEIFDIEPGHSAESPRLRRLSSPVAHHPLFWEFATGVVADVAADLVGPDVKFHHSKLNFKWSGGAAIRWHQDITGWPHTNYSPLTIGVYLDDVGDEQGPLGVIPGSHEDELYKPCDASGVWTGVIGENDYARLRPERAVYLTGPAGSVTVHNCRTVHGSKPNPSTRPRPLLLNVFSAADAMPYTANQLPTRYAGAVVRGEPARWARHDPRPCLLPPERPPGPLISSGIFEAASPTYGPG